MKRLTAGEPVYRPDEEATGAKNKTSSSQNVTKTSDQSATAAAITPQELVSFNQPTGPKIYPEVVVERSECRVRDYDMELTVQAQNNSLEEVMLDNIFVLGRNHELDFSLNPGQEREFVVYNGPMPKGPNQSHCELRYRTENGDYFSANHHVDFQPEIDGYFSVRRIRFIPPVKDV